MKTIKFDISKLKIDGRNDMNIDDHIKEAIGKTPRNGNPLVSHKFGADPYALVYKDRVYIYNTNDHFEYNENGQLKENTYANINKISVISTSDLVNWTDHGEISIAGTEGAAKWATQSWAPAAAYKKINGQDRFFLYFANNASGIGVLTSETPIGPWIDPIKKPLISRETPGVEGVTWLFDPAVLVDKDESAYIYFGGGLPEGEYEMPNTARVMELGEDMISVLGEATSLPAPFMFEDSGIHRVNDTYYYSYCSNFYKGERPEGSPGAGEIAYMTSHSPMGPWTYQKTILKNPSHFFQVGGNNHHAIFQFKDNWYITYHAQTLSKALGVPKGYRSTHINRLEMNHDGSIQEVEANMKGVEQIQDYPQVSTSTDFAWSSRIEVLNKQIKHNEKRVVSLKSGDWIALSGVNFSEGVRLFSALVLCEYKNLSLQIRAQSLQGPILANIEAPISGQEEWKTVEVDLRISKGTHDIYIILNGGGNSEFLFLENWSFQ